MNGDFAACIKANKELADNNMELRELLRDCAEHFRFLREQGVFVWPNHPLNPEERIRAALNTRAGEL